MHWQLRLTSFRDMEVGWAPWPSSQLSAWCGLPLFSSRDEVLRRGSHMQSMLHGMRYIFCCVEGARQIALRCCSPHCIKNFSKSKGAHHDNADRSEQ